MSELIQQMLQNGQELQTGDVTNMGQSAIMDDRVLAEILRMLPNTGSVSRLILPYATDTDDTNTTVQPSGSANGSVLIAPFRAVVGSRTASGTDGVKSWRDIRSGVFVAGAGVYSAVPATGLSVLQGFTANVSGLNRWDLVYAAVTPDLSLTAVNRAVKSPVNGTVTTNPTVTQLACQVAINVVVGTPNASPVVPAAPADGGGIYYIPLAYVLIPNGFSGGSTIKTWHIMPIAPTPIALSKGLGGANAVPANQQYTPGGSVVTAAQETAWANNSTSSISARPQVFMPSDMVGMETLWVALSVLTSTAANWSHQNFGLVDSSRDWRNRIFRATLFVQQGGTAQWAWGRSPSLTATNLIPDIAHNNTTPEVMAGNIALQFGQSFVQTATDLPGTPPGSGYAVCYANNTVLTGLTNGIGLYVDTSGNLRVYINGLSNNANMFIWLEASRPYGNY